MRTAPADLARTRHDVLVIGGGIHGLFAAYDAASRGLSVALVERDDFGGGLSFNHQRTVHGGLRDVGAGRLAKARAQIAERRHWTRMAPHLIRPQPFLVATYRFSKRSRWMLKVGLRAYDFIGRGRNVDVPPELHLPAGRLETATVTRHLFPDASPVGLTGGAVWYDYQTIWPDRLNWTVALAAVRAGARLANYADAMAPLEDGGRVTGARVSDITTGTEHEIHAAVTLVAAGGGLPALAERFGLDGAPPLVRAMNLLVDRPARSIATAAPGPTGRMLTLVPWRGLALVGTYQSADVVTVPETAPPAVAIDAMLADVNATFPSLHVGRADVRMIHHGLTPATAQNGRADLLSEPAILRHADRGRPGIVSLVGVKFTTARLAAEWAIDEVVRTLGRSTAPCRTAARPLPHADITDAEGRLAEALRRTGIRLDQDVSDHLAAVYGDEAVAIVEYAAEHGLTRRLAAGTPVLEAEIAHAVVSGAAWRLSDAVLRRTPLGSAGHPGRDALERAADVMGGVAGWSAERRTREIALVEARYLVP